MFETYVTRPTKVRALQVGENVSDLLRIAAAILETGGQAAVEETGEVHVLKVLTKGWRNMMRAQAGRWIVLHENGEAEILSDQEFRAAYRPDNPELTLFTDDYGLPLTESVD